MKKIIILFITFICVIFISCESKENKANLEVIPLPQEIRYTQGTFTLNNTTQIVYSSQDSSLKFNAYFLQESIKELTGLELDVVEGETPKNAIFLNNDYQHYNKEAYNIQISSENIRLNGSSSAGNFYAIQTLIKSIEPKSSEYITFQTAEIKDFPRFAYRGMMLDVGRRFYNIEFIKKYIDILSRHNMNVFHWHLTEDQGWRIEIEKYPKLTEIGSQRKQTKVNTTNGNYEDTGEIYGPYFYTKEEIKDVVEYARQRYITIIPEIDLPGHMLAALASYPELGCTGGPYEAASSRGVFEDVLCVGNEKVFSFLQDIFDEIIELFPSEYIHIGGDECPKVKWQSCPKCQARAKSLKIKDEPKNSIEHQLQSYFITRVEKYLNSKGKNIIGWDEILEGGLAPNATVMSWRGVKGGIEAARSGHNVIMTPSQFMYFDYYQSRDIENEPFSIGNYLPIEKVYNYEPYDEQLTPEESKYILGVQANLWTEYIADEDVIEYMIMPRIEALSEVQWTMPEYKNYDNFLNRLQRTFLYYDFKEYNYAKHIYEVDIQTKMKNDGIEVSLVALDGGKIYYTTDGSNPNRSSKEYNTSFIVKESCEIKAIAIYEEYTSSPRSKNLTLNKATNKEIKLKYAPANNWKFEGAKMLVDGSLGNSNYTDGTWLGFHGTDVDAIVDLGVIDKISSVQVGTYHRIDNRIFGITEFLVYTSNDGIDYTEQVRQEYPILEKESIIGRNDLKLEFAPIEARFVHIVLSKTNRIPDWHISTGDIPLLFVDEIIIE